MGILASIVALFAIVDPIGNIPIFIDAASHVEKGQSQKAFNTAVAVGVIILLIFSFAGELVLGSIFHIEIDDLKIAGGLLLLIIAIDHLIFGSLKRSISVSGKVSPHEIGCVPIACPLLAGPGAMVTCITSLEAHGPTAVIISIVAVFGVVWLVMSFVETLQRLLGRLFCMVFSKVMCMFIAAIGVHMIMTGIKAYLF